MEKSQAICTGKAIAQRIVGIAVRIDGLACSGGWAEKVAILTDLGRTVTFSIGFIEEEGGIIAGEAIARVWIECVASWIDEEAVAADTVLARRATI